MPPYTVATTMDIDIPKEGWGDLSTALHNIFPYGNDLAQEASDMLTNIIRHFGLCLKSEDWAPGAIYWAKQLSEYLDLKYALPKETRVAFAKVFWELTIAPGMDATMVEIWAHYCRRLLNKRLAKVVRLVETAQRFFPAEATDEILEEFLPKMTTSSLPELLKAQTYLCTFLPTDIATGRDPRDWMPAIFRIWSMVVRSSEADRNFLSLIGRVAEDNVGIKDMFTQDQIRAVFTAGLSALNLPVGKGQRTNAVDAEGGTSHKAVGRNDMRMTSFVKFIVNTINPITERETPKASSLTHLRDLIQAIESFFHPSNSGPWSHALALFVQSFAWDFLQRMKREEEDACTTPFELRLTPEICDTFVNTIKGVTFLSMFSKDQRAVAQTHMALRYLAWISPKLILPGVLERAYPSLESLTETHRTTSVISALGSLAVPLLNPQHYPQGGKHLTPLLHLTVPGVDLNDPAKTWYTVMLVSSLITTVPVRDLTTGGSSGFQWGGMEEDIMDSDDVVDLEMEDANRKATTAEFEEWLFKFLRRSIAMFENYPDVGQSNKNTIENSVTGTISYCFEVLFNQLSKPLYDRTTKLVLELVESTPLINASKAMSAFVSCWASADRENAMAKIFPILDRQIRSEIEHGASSVPSLAYSNLQRDSSLHYYQTLLNQVILRCDIVSHREEIKNLFRLMLEKCQDRRGYKLAAKLMLSSLQSLLFTHVLDIRSHDASQWEDENFMSDSHKHWGTLGEPGCDDLKWHTPSNQEIDFAIDLIETFHNAAMTRARELMTTTLLEGKQLSIEFCKSITNIKAFVTGMVTMVEDDGDSPSSNASLGEDTASIQPLNRIKVGYCLTDRSDARTQKIRNIRAETGQLLHELMAFFHTKREDDVENIKVLVKTARVFLSDHGVDGTVFDNNKRGYEFLKRASALPGKKKLYPRFLRCRRAAFQHFLRCKVNSFGRAKTELHDALIMDLTDLSLSQYTDVRKKSQLALLRAVRCFQGAKNLVLPTLLKALESSNKDYERMKGALYLLSAKSLALPCLRDWRYVPEYVLRLCTAYHADKPSVQTLVRKCFVEYIINMTNTSFKVLMSGDFARSIQDFGDAHGLKHDSDTLSRATAKAKSRRLDNVKAYDNLVVALTNVVQDTTLHWRYQTMAMSFLELYMRPEIPTSLELAQFETKSLLSEMPMVRKIALSSLSVIMVNTKIRTFAQGDAYSLIVRKATNPLKRVVTLPENVPEDFTWEYLKASVTEINYESPEKGLLDDSIGTGWLVWPKSFKAYLPRTDSFVMPEVDPESKPAYDHLEQFFGDASFWEKLIEFMAQEPVRGERHDAFNSEHARFFKSIFGLWEDRLLGVVIPTITALCAKSEDKNAQRTASELIGGLIRGSKHWKKGSLDGMWSWLTPLLKKSFQQCTPDSLVYWERFVKYCCLFRDPRRVLPLISLIFNTPLDKDSTAAFSESKNLFFTRAVLVSLSWRVSLLTPVLREECLRHISHPYKQVREILGHVINELFQLSSHPSYKSVKELLQDQAKQLDQPSRMVEELDEKSAHQVQLLRQSLSSWKESHKPSIQGASDYSNASKTVLAWVFQALSGWRVQATYGVVLPLVPELFLMQDVPDDQDLQQLATLSLLQLARFAYPADMVPKVVDLLCKILKESESWHVRNNVLPVVQIFFYTNLFSMDVQMMVRVMDAVSSMLLDSQIEVRQLAATTLSGIVRCSQRDATQALFKHFRRLLRDTPLPARKKRDRTTGAPKESDPEGYSEALIKRHAGVLGLSSLVEAFPYDVPEWMPQVLVFLSGYFSDPPPVSTTVKKVFSDFKRTHQDTWHEDSKRFSQEELEVLSDMLISPSYYA
ncbi:hypothetical protein BGZ83_005704 [Gryganskiella cystojenkinii]|nr:hypothetical protein BGZ83_005704 [Gryganskiella cystojenkinii]